MPLSKMFWFMIFVTFIFVAVQIIGFPVLEYIILMIIIDLVLIEVSRELSKDKVNSKLREELMKRINYIEELAHKIINHIEGGHHSVNHLIESKFEEQKSEFKNEMDRMAKKAIDIENKLYRLKDSVNSALVMFDDRIRKVEKSDVEMTPDV